MVIEQVPEVVHHVLADRCRKVLLDVGCHGTARGNSQHRDNRPIEQRGMGGIDADHVREPSRKRLGADDMVEDDLERPRLEQIGATLHQHRGERHQQQLPIRAEQMREVETQRTTVGHSTGTGAKALP
jgi:hypothetical protein